MEFHRQAILYGQRNRHQHYTFQPQLCQASHCQVSRARPSNRRSNVIEPQKIQQIRPNLRTLTKCQITLTYNEPIVCCERSLLTRLKNQYRTNISRVGVQPCSGQGIVPCQTKLVEQHNCLSISTFGIVTRSCLGSSVLTKQEDRCHRRTLAYSATFRAIKLRLTRNFLTGQDRMRISKYYIKAELAVLVITFQYFRAFRSANATSDDGPRLGSVKLY